LSKIRTAFPPGRCEAPTSGFMNASADPLGNVIHSTAILSHLFVSRNVLTTDFTSVAQRSQISRVHPL
jgi:hypothetical protein